MTTVAISSGHIGRQSSAVAHGLDFDAKARRGRGDQAILLPGQRWSVVCRLLSAPRLQTHV